MSELVQVRKRAQVTLPRSVREALNIQEGDFLALEVRGNQLVLQVQKPIGKGEAWPWGGDAAQREAPVPPMVGSSRVHGCEVGDAGQACPTLRGERRPPLKEIGL